MTLEIGQVVHIKSDLNIDYDYHNSPGYIGELEEWRGKPLTVKCTHLVDADECARDDWFKVEENDWTWSIYWIEEDDLKDIADEEFLSLFEGD